jgi:hypothetical protein
MDSNASMQPLSLPSYPFRIIQEGGKTLIFDPFRKKYVALTPEEWVRQHFLAWLSVERDYPVGLISVEAPLKYHRLHKRADGVVYHRSGKPLMVVECKAPSVKITQEVFDQVARYNMAFGVPFLAVTNGLEHFCCRRSGNSQGWEFLEEIPTYSELAAAFY